MDKNDLFEQLSQRLAAVLPMAGEMSAELKARVQGILKQGLSDMDILTREEFETQSAALSRAEKRLEELEASLKALEAKLESSAN